MSLAGDFLRMATSGRPTESHPLDPKSTVVVKMCKGKCGILSPHIGKAGYHECAWCLHQIHDQADPKRQNIHQG